MAATTPGISPHYSPWRSFPDRADQRESIGSPARAGQIPCVLDTIPVFSLAKAVPPRLTLRPAPSCSVICTFAERFRSPRRQNSGPNTRAASACLATSRCRRDTEQAPRQAPLHHPKLQAVQTFSNKAGSCNFPIGFRIQRHATSKANVAASCFLGGHPHYVHHCYFASVLHGISNVLVPVIDVALWNACRSQARRHASKRFRAVGH